MNIFQEKLVTDAGTDGRTGKHEFIEFNWRFPPALIFFQRKFFKLNIQFQIEILFQL